MISCGWLDSVLVRGEGLSLILEESLSESSRKSLTKNSDVENNKGGGKATLIIVREEATATIVICNGKGM